jgi:hypothetical protein
MRTRLGLVASALVVSALSGPAVHATALSVALDVQGAGLSLVASGVGLRDAPHAGTIDVDIAGPVQGALLYWAGRDRPCPQSAGNCIIPSQPYKDQQLLFAGQAIVGTIIGTEGQPVSGGGPINNIGYLADVTSFVQAAGLGPQSFTVADGNAGSNLFRLDGASLVVIYSDAADPMAYRLIVFDGLDFAFGPDPTPGETRVTTAVTFGFDPSTAARQADLWIVGGDVDPDNSPARPNRLEISSNPDVWNSINGSDGDSWDSDLHLVNVPANANATTVQLFSQAHPTQPDPNFPQPASVIWELAALRVPLATVVAAAEGCTPGYWKNHTASWAGTGYSPTQTAGSVFSAAAAFPSLAGATLQQSLHGGGGSGVGGAARILLRAATAALLNAASPGVDYPTASAALIAEVNAALASGNRAAILELAGELDFANNLGCPLS